MLTQNLKILNAAKDDINSTIENHPRTKGMICTWEDSFTLVVKNETNTIIAILSAFFRDIPAPLAGSKECFIMLVDVFDKSLQRKGIGSMLVQKAIETAKTHDAAQVRAYCDIDNIASHMLWFKNGFGISPMKQSDGTVPGSFCTFRLL